jgi:hypothetical protein
MIARVWLTFGAVAFSSSSGMGCRHHARPSANPAVMDSLAGVVSVTGTSYEQHLVLRVGADTRALAASPGDSSALVRLGGAEISVYGKAGVDRFAVAAFTVTAVNGQAVVDGVLLREGTRLVLRTRTGRLTLGNPPAALDSLIGARIWVGGPIDTGPNVYGVISPQGVR